jgi:predicted nucleic acid-binding Zn ribbon protein
LKFSLRAPIKPKVSHCFDADMPKYDYLCEANGQIVEVSHPMSERLATWGEVCERTLQQTGDTPADAPVKKLITGGGVVRAGALKNPELPPCQTGAPCCGANSCGFN